MTERIAFWVGVASLAGLIVLPAALVFAGNLAGDTAKLLMLAGTVLWFGSAPIAWLHDHSHLNMDGPDRVCWSVSTIHQPDDDQDESVVGG